MPMTTTIRPQWGDPDDHAEIDHFERIECEDHQREREAEREIETRHLRAWAKNLPRI